MAEQNRNANDEETVADVSIDTMYYLEQPATVSPPAPTAPAESDGEFVLSFAEPAPKPEPVAQPTSDGQSASPQSHSTGQVQGKHNNARRGSPTANRPGKGKNKRKGIQKRQPESLPRKILGAPFRLVNKVSAWVMGSGINSRNPLLVTLRLITVMFPIFISIYISYLQMEIMFPGAGSIFSDKNETRLLVEDSHNPVIQVGAKKLTIPLPDEFEIIDTEQFFKRYPITKSAAAADGFNVTFAARRTDAPDSVYFLTVGTTGEHAARNYDEKSFAKMLRDLMRIRDAAASLQQGPNQTDIPFDVTARSACFGRMASTIEYVDRTRKATEAFRQYSCMLYLDGKAITINVGYAYYTAKSENADSGWCLRTLQKWRDTLLEQYK